MTHRHRSRLSARPAGAYVGVAGAELQTALAILGSPLTQDLCLALVVDTAYAAGVLTALLGGALRGEGADRRASASEGALPSANGSTPQVRTEEGLYITTRWVS